MQIVIDIPQEVYDEALSGDGTGAIWAGYVKNGIPLPEHHGRLIDIDMLEGKVEKHRKMLKISEYDRELILHYTDIEMAPTIIEADKTEE